jgi:hypothetical protein
LSVGLLRCGDIRDFVVVVVLEEILAEMLSWLQQASETSITSLLSVGLLGCGWDIVVALMEVLEEILANVLSWLQKACESWVTSLWCCRRRCRWLRGRNVWETREIIVSLRFLVLLVSFVVVLQHVLSNVLCWLQKACDPCFSCLFDGVKVFWA